MNEVFVGAEPEGRRPQLTSCCLRCLWPRGLSIFVNNATQSTKVAVKTGVMTGQIGQWECLRAVIIVCARLYTGPRLAAACSLPLASSARVRGRQSQSGGVCEQCSIMETGCQEIPHPTRHS